MMHKESRNEESITSKTFIKKNWKINEKHMKISFFNPNLFPRNCFEDFELGSLNVKGHVVHSGITLIVMIE